LWQPHNQRKRRLRKYLFLNSVVLLLLFACAVTIPLARVNAQGPGWGLIVGVVKARVLDVYGFPKNEIPVVWASITVTMPGFRSTTQSMGEGEFWIYAPEGYANLTVSHPLFKDYTMTVLVPSGEAVALPVIYLN
jgi:hypothetical protein